MVNCVHASDPIPSRIVPFVRCALGLFGGRPSLGVCAKACTARKPKDATQPAILGPVTRRSVPPTTTAPAAAADQRPFDWSEVGPRLWAAFHRWTLTVSGETPEAVEWLRSFSRGVPCGDCKAHWYQMLERTPPRWDDLFAWGVERHNEVSKRLGKPEVTIAEARRFLGRG